MNKIVNGKGSTPLYTVSTHIFTSLEEAEAQMQKWNNEKGLDPKSKVFEITGEVFEPRIKLVKSSLEQEHDKEEPF